jgi:hypothetical protein
MVIVEAKNPCLKRIAATAPADWERRTWGDPMPEGSVILCEERTIELLIANPVKNAIHIVFDSVRQPKGFASKMAGPVITIDAPADGATWLWTPVDPSLYQPKPFKDRHGVIFPGRINNYNERWQTLNRLLRCGAGVQIIERDDKNRTYADYIRDLCSAKAVVNFCADRKTGKPQLKGRVFETLMAGAVLIEESNPLTSEYLMPHHEYISWVTDQDLVSAVSRVNNDNDSSMVMANKGEAIARTEFSADFFWFQVEDLANA